MYKTKSLKKLMTIASILFLCFLNLTAENKTKPMLSIDVIYTPGMSTFFTGQKISEQTKRAVDYKTTLIKKMKKSGYRINDKNYDYKFIIYFQEQPSSSIWPTYVGFDIGHYSKFEIMDKNNTIVKSSGNWNGPSMNQFSITDWDKRIISELTQLLSPFIGSLQSSSVTNNLNDVYFLDENNGWAVGKNVGILKSDDGGKTWAKITNNETYYGIYAFDKNNIIAIGPQCNLTNDGGNSWNTIAKKYTYGSAYLDLFFTDKINGWLVGSSKSENSSYRYKQSTIIKTNDGGATWTAQRNENYEWISSISFIDQNYGWAIGSSGSKSANSWPRTEYGFLLGEFSPTLYKTTDGGNTWEKSKIAQASRPLIIKFISSKIGYILDNGFILKTIDGGNTWQKKDCKINKRFNDLCFINQNVGWIVGNDGIILKTIDSGESWKLFKAEKDVNLNSVFFINESTGWIVGEKGVIIQIKNE